MGSKRNSELRRLEEALMEEEDLVFDFSQASSAKSRQANSAPVCKAINTDRTDVDLESYRAEAQQTMRIQIENENGEKCVFFFEATARAENIAPL